MIYYYSVKTGTQESQLKSFKGYPSDTLRIAITADFLHQHNITPILNDDIHLFVTAGDHLRWGLHEKIMKAQLKSLEEPGVVFDGTQVFYGK